MHEPKVSALRNLERYCNILVHTLKHLKQAKCVINITYCCFARKIIMALVHFNTVTNCKFKC